MNISQKGELNFHRSSEHACFIYARTIKGSSPLPTSDFSSLFVVPFPAIQFIIWVNYEAFWQNWRFIIELCKILIVGECRRHCFY